MFVRTEALGKTLDDEGISHSSFDDLYEKSRTYDTFARKVAAELKRRQRGGRHVCYCVDGSVCEDTAACLLLGMRGVDFVDGGSKASYFAAAAGLEGGYTACSAFSLKGQELALPLVVYDITEDNVADVKLLLSERFGDEAPALYVAEGKGERIPLFEADRKRKSPAGLVLFRQPLLEKKKYTFDDFVAVMRRLRAPDGCPWDKVQTHQSIRINAIEEAYELVDAIDADDPDKICEEAGDVLMQSVFHSLMEEERGSFTVSDMLTALCEKLITRHTHIFGRDRAENAEGALSVWDRNKMAEKHQTTYSDAVNDVPACFPALLRAQKIVKRVAKGGWDFCSRENIEKKLREEYAELMAAFAAGDKAAVSDELGDVLMCMAWLGRYVGADCEMSLLDAVKKVQARYTAFEALVLSDGKDPNALSDEEWRGYYRRAKDAARA